MDELIGNNLSSSLRGYITRSILVASILFSSFISFAQGWDVAFGGQKEDWGESVLQTNDQGYIIAGFSESFGDLTGFDVYVIRTDVDGTEIWSKVFDEGFSNQFGHKIIKSEDNGFLIVGDNFANGGVSSSYLLKISKYGKKEWSKTYGEANIPETGVDIAPASDGSGYAIIGSSLSGIANDNDILVIKVDNEGNEIWRKTYGQDKRDEGTSISPISDGFIITAITREALGPNNDIFISRINNIGDTIWTRTIGDAWMGESVNKVITDRNDNIVIIGSSNGFKKNFIAKYDLSGEEIWRRTFGQGITNELNDIIELEDGSLVAVGYAEKESSSTDIFLAKFDQEGNTIWAKTVGDETLTDIGYAIAPRVGKGFVITGFHSIIVPFGNDVSLITTDENGNFNSNQITGKVFFSDDGCNPFEENDTPLSQWLVKAESTNATYFASTDEEGNYHMSVDSGLYSLQVLPVNDYWASCNPLGFGVTFNQFYDTTRFDFPIVAETICPSLSIDISADPLIICENADYTVSYSNQGTQTATDAYVEVIFEDELSYNSSSITPTIDGDIYRFSLGDIAPSQEGSFVISATVSCDGLEEGQASGVTAHIYPDSLCNEPSENWDGSSIQLTGNCENGQITFLARNVGQGDMIQARNSFVIEDHLILLTQPIDLGAGEEEEIASIHGDGSTYRVLAEQSEGHPGNSYPTVAIEGCVEEGQNYSTGSVTEFPENDQDDFIAIDVQEAISSDNTIIALRGYPKGFDDEAIISPNTDLTYTVVFKNVGTDTINRMVIRDTLPTSLDISTVRPGSSSHPYDFEIYDDGHIKFTFNDINLPGSSAGAEASRGFVKFKVSQKSNTPIGTYIRNRAAIFFDYHEPAYSEEVVHLVGCSDFFDYEEGCIIINTDDPENANANIKVYPNPFEEKAIITIGGADLDFENLRFRLFNPTGKLVQIDNFTGTTYEFYRKNYAAGIYFFTIESENRTLGSGKIVLR